jgi:hypothetical protein
MSYSDINIPSSTVVEWSNGIKDGGAAIAWWNSLSDQQKDILSGGAVDFLLQQKIRQSQTKDGNHILELIEKQREIDSLELSIDKSLNMVRLGGNIDRDFFGVRGFCFSQSDNFVKEVLSSGDLKIYSNNDWAIRHGQKTVDLVRIALNSIPDIEAIQTDPNSMADVGLRWDMILIFKKTHFFPIQIKSSFAGIQQALEEGKLGNYADIQMNRIEEAIARSESDYINKSTKLNSRIIQKSSEKAFNEKVLRLRKNSEKYRWSMPLYIWAAQKTQNISYLVQLFVNTFKIDVDAKEISAKAIDEYIKIEESLKRENERQEKQKREERRERTKKYLEMNSLEEKNKRWRESNSLISKQIIEHLETQIKVRTLPHLPKTRKRDEVIDLINITIKELKTLVHSYSVNSKFNKPNLFNNQYNKYDSDEEILLKSSISNNFERIMAIDKSFFKSRFRDTEIISRSVDELTGFLDKWSDMMLLSELDTDI